MPITTNKITLVVGDWSGDGHEKTDDFVIDTPFTEKEIEKAYKKGVKVMGIDLVEDCCEDYEDRRLPCELISKLIETGFDIHQLHDIQNGRFTDDEIQELIDGDESVSVWSEQWLRIYLHFVKVGNPEFTYQDAECNGRICIGGYGLFY